MTEQHLAVLRRHMVELIAIHVDLSSEELGRDRISDRVLEAMLRIPRHLFVPSPLASVAYQDSP
ncbi:MAG: protein-L-isoaspartate O-methyltransferase, partial [Alphaproteobacteria bacterium]|nr:protein-L-isoaspartate O-methyltransferase [Alphaproteobacteria bacterium]